MQAAAVPVDWFHVDTADVEGGFAMPRLRLHDRRGEGRPQRLAWVFQRHLEMLLFHRFEGGTSGAVHKLLGRTGLGRTALHTAAVMDRDEPAHALLALGSDPAARDKFATLCISEMVQHMPKAAYTALSHFDKIDFKERNRSYYLRPLECVRITKTTVERNGTVRTSIDDGEDQDHIARPKYEPALPQIGWWDGDRSARASTCRRTREAGRWLDGVASRSSRPSTAAPFSSELAMLLPSPT